jgi:hypothetical protein
VAALTAPQEVLLAAASLSGPERRDFSEWDLTVAVWQGNPNKFGARGYETLYPDHKRVMMEIMAKNKTDNPLRRGWLERTRPNHYRITALGSAEAARIGSSRGETGSSVRSAANLYDAVVRYADHRVFKAHSRDSDEPSTWLDVEAFLGISRNDPTHVADKLRAARNSITSALQWLSENNQEALRRTQGSGLTFRRNELEKLLAMISSLPVRFRVQFDALLRKPIGESASSEG